MIPTTPTGSRVTVASTSFAVLRRDFLADRPEVTTYARFRATAERHGRQWRQWPVRMRDGIIGFTDVDPMADLYHRYVQWIAHEQLGDLAARLRRRGQALALDLPLGCHPDGYDVWITPPNLAIALSVVWVLAMIVIAPALIAAG